MSGDTMTIHVAPHGGRTCGSCNLCCKLVPVSSLDKRAGERCKHQSAACGCKVYARRPLDCAAWSCQWLANPAAAALHRPDRSHYVVDPLPDMIRITEDGTGEVHQIDVMQVWVDPAFPFSYRDPALYGLIENVAANHGMATLVRWGNVRGTVIFAPCLSADGQWHEQDAGKPRTDFGRYSTLPASARPPL